MKINPAQLNHVRPLRPGVASAEQQVAEAKEVREAFRSFIGEAFFGQMLKSMRSTVGKPAYFHGGQAEEIFRSQLDQTLAQEMTESSAAQIADPMFRQQFPRQAEVLRQAEGSTKPTLDDLNQLTRR
ncbi:MAG: rod-binding protein [Planctomycetales bacterium]|nr:rod-binding protein [Planctomycetales bacterium]